MAAAFAATKGTFANSAVCYGCGKPGHIKKFYFSQKEAKPKTPDICPRCRKGRHFSNQCRSKYDSEGHPIQGNRNSSAERWRAETQIHQPTQMPVPQPTQMIPPQMPAPQAQPLRMPSGGSPQVFT
ncbi:POK9 protein, partial [Brachypodius atriceps]|nr:POK9 protein [Brachypodius atriceps]